MLIRNLVVIDEQAEFRNDVQLSDYDDPQINLALLKSYLFTFNAPQGWESSVGLLKIILDSFSSPRLDNRIAVIANYGHGKSHLALALANYFGKPHNSTEVKVVLDKISKAVDNPAQAQRYSEFRQNHREYLIIRLRGDEPRSLREQFVFALEQALAEHRETKDVKLPFWYQKAEVLLEALSNDNLFRANNYLEAYSYDVPMLLQDVRQRRDSAYDLCRDLFTHLHGVQPDFRGEVSIRQTFNWAVKEFCGDGKPLGGILVLFDEFSLYIQRYAQRSAAGELQDLLNGIEDQKGKSVFLCFAQHDPVTMARNILKTGQGLESLEKELNRIPRKVSLYSLMESVIDSYLNQPEKAWRDFRATQAARGPLARASNITLDVFRKRYEDNLHWETEKFDEIVTKGCFPLHPLTTALLSDLRLQSMASVGNPRTVLGFVFEQITLKKDQVALDGNKIQWVLAVELVDYFGNYLPENTWLLYEHARRVLGPNAPVEQERILKALLLQESGRLPVTRDTHVHFLSEASGVPYDQTIHHLKAMAEARCIRYDPRTRLNSFWPIAADPHRLEEILQQRMAKEFLGTALVDKFNVQYAQPIRVNVPWGHSEDWQAVERILPYNSFNPDQLKTILPQFSITTGGEFVEGVRGAVIWLLAQNENEVTQFRQTAANVLEQAFPGECPPPVVLMLPSRPNPELIEAFLKKSILDSFSVEDRKEVGTEIYEHEKGQLEKAVNDGLASLRGGDSNNYTSISRSINVWVVPASYRAALQAKGKMSLMQILSEAYHQAYRFSPPEFHTQYRVATQGANKLRDATKLIAVILRSNSLPSNRQAISANPVARDLCDKVLWQRWQLLSSDYRIQEPGDYRIQEGWKWLEKSLPAGTKEFRVRDALMPLLNPPYGYDYNSATLLFCAWIGYHIHDLQASRNGRRITLDMLVEPLQRGSKNFLQQICNLEPVGISRRDHTQTIREAQALIEMANRQNFTQTEAQDAIAKLVVFADDQALPSELTQSAAQAAQNLTAASDLAKSYDGAANKIQETLQDQRNVGMTIDLRHRITELPRLGNVGRTAPSVEDLHLEWKRRLESLVQSECRKLEKIQHITQVELNQSRLEEIKKQLKKAKLTELVARVDQSLDTIQSHRQELEQQNREAPIQAGIRGITHQANLQKLYEYREQLQKITGYSDTTMRQRDERLKAIEGEIEQLIIFATQLRDAAIGLTDLRSVREWQSQFQRLYARLQDTPFQQEFDTANEQVLRLQELILEFEALKKMPTNLYEAETTYRRLKSLREQNDGWLPSAHKQGIERASNQLGVYVQQKIEQARIWCDKLEKQLASGEVQKVIEALKVPPAFLQDADKKRIETLQQQVQAHLDQDVVAKIEAQFRQIADPALRQKCLDRLNDVHSENS